MDQIETRRNRVVHALIGATLVLLVAGVSGAFSATAAPLETQSASQLLAEIIEEMDQRASGGGGGDSLEAAERAADDARALLVRLDAIDPAELTHSEDLTLQVLHWNADAAIAQVDLYWYYSPVLPSTSTLRIPITTAPAQAFEGEEDLEAYLEMLGSVVDQIDASHRKVRGRAARMIVLPDEQIDRVIPFVGQFTELSDTSFLSVSDERLQAIDGAPAAAFQARVTELIDWSIIPAAEALIRTLDELRPRAPNAVGWAQYPGGKEAFRIATRLQTTLDISPEEVHRRGLEGVADINRQMAKVRVQLGFTGTKAEFHAQIRNDPRFYVDSPDAVGAALMEHITRIEPHVADYFLRTPEAPYGVTRLHPALEPSMTYGFYSRPSGAEARGLYNFNGSTLDERSLVGGAGLIFHELIPGHHFQINLQAENESLPRFRRFGYFAGYGEGWGEYSSSVVAREMGMYEDPYDLYGRLVFDNFFAVRLVVDTGMNFYGWSRPKAMLFMRENTLESDVQIDSETIRYSIRSPAQALAYRMGRQTWVRLRQKAADALGDGFDIRRFHDAVLMVGSLPLIVLENHVDWWIEQELAR